ncbi:hypothetical protein L861_22540 [Litchfieldella anticariensis FP35 = DSM 16096]|uniref:Uncharacterized protein n=1 Tax=Litchfieldella anticariensis (strain DSM 16096 / CECT 5854 / CIP 108499 / LMG 22089 / FP35) TaxID=1121939 RepID=S2LEA0_LITA3|nr:hypothetical protein L861_22540 [Halomonas anticariensis FP35 = DSM 16096]
MTHAWGSTEAIWRSIEAICGSAEAHRSMPMLHVRGPSKDNDPMLPLETTSHDADLHARYRHYPLTSREHDRRLHLTGLNFA